MNALFPRVGTLPSGLRDAITDVGQVRVGHCTLAHEAMQTGVTVILPHEGDVFTRRPLAACCVLNGFGKSVGLMQLQELGCLETPLALTNTFAVGRVAMAQIGATLAAHPQVGRDWPTVNPLVLECNDGYLNDIRNLVVHEAHYDQALHEARSSAGLDVLQGSVGAGRGMSCFQLKGGIGTASRVAQAKAGSYTVGALVLANFGKLEQCRLGGHAVGALLAERLEQASLEQASLEQASLEQASLEQASLEQASLEQASLEQALSGDQCSGEQVCGARSDSELFDSALPEKGSIIMVLATDAPLDTLQLGRVARRAGAGLARTGSVYGHGSGDVVVAFSTSQHLPWPEPDQPLALSRLPDTQLDALFLAAAEATEQAIIKALFLATPVQGRDGHWRALLPELWPQWKTVL